MFPNLALFYVCSATVSIALLLKSWRVDRVLGGVVALALCVSVGGAAAIGWWTQHAHGRDYFAGDEVAYQWEGARLLRAWRTDTTFTRATVGAYAPINAAVIAVAGRGQTPMRVATAVVSTCGVAAAYWLAFLLYRSRTTARLAALFAAVSPVLVLYSWANLRDRWIGVAALACLIAASLLMQRMTWMRMAALACGLIVLGELRHYWAALLGWIVVATYIAAARRPLSAHALRSLAVLMAVGLALAVPTGSFLAFNMRGETAVRYATVVPAARERSATARATSTASGAGSAGDRSTPDAGAAALDDGLGDLDAPPSSGPTLGLSEPARPESARELIANLRFVLFGSVRPHADGGQYASKLLMPEALLAYLIWPLAILGFVEACRRAGWTALAPALYCVGFVAILTWLRGDDWNTYRFRSLYWAVTLIFAAGGVVWLYEQNPIRRERTRMVPQVL